MMALLLILNYLFNIAYSDCSWQLGAKTLDLSCLKGTIVNPMGDGTGYSYKYSICKNSAGSCNNSTAMMCIQTFTSGACYEVAKWDYQVGPQYDETNGWQFVYRNGEACDQTYRALEVSFICNQTTDIWYGNVIEDTSSNPCSYILKIYTKYACNGAVCSSNPTIYPTYNPTNAPITSSPSVYPSIHPTTTPTIYPSIMPTNATITISPSFYPSNNPTLTPVFDLVFTTTNGNVSTFDNQETKQSEASFRGLFLWIILSITILFIILGVFGYIYSKCFLQTLHHKYSLIAIFIFGFYSIDFITDIFFILFVYDDYVYHNVMMYFLWIFLVSLSVIIIQIISNLIQLNRDMKLWIVGNNEHGAEIANYLNKYSILMYTLCVFSGNSYGVIRFCCSHFLNINCFKLPLKINQQMRSQNKNILLNLLWNVPHLVTEIIYSLYVNKLTDIVLAAVLFNGFSMIITLFSYFTRKNLLKHYNSNFDTFGNTGNKSINLEAMINK